MKPNIASLEHEKQLQLLRDTTQRFGILHDAQVLQIKMWPITLFTHAKKCDAHIDIEQKRIDYIILSSKGDPPEDMEKRMEEIGRASCRERV